MKKVFSFLSLLILTIFSISGQQDISFEYYSVKDGLSQNTVNAIIQDSKGFMWFGTWDGLNKFDGYEFTVFKSRPGDQSKISTNRIDYIHEDKSGYIWFQTYEGRIHRFDPRKEKFYSLPFITNRYIYGVERERRFIETVDGDLWIATNDIGAIRVITDKETGDIKTYQFSTFSENQISDNHVNFVQEDNQKNIWLGTKTALHCISSNNNQIRSYQPETGEEINSFHSFLNTADFLWFGDKDGNLWKFSVKSNRFTKIYLGVKTIITDIKLIDNYHLILTTNNAGFFVYNRSNNQISNFNSGNQPTIKTNNFISVKVDSYKTAWLESEQTGVFRYRLSDNSVKYFRPQTDAVSRISVLPNFMVIEDVKKRVWINPQGGGFSLYNRQKDELEYFYNNPGSSSSRFSNVIHSAYTDKEGNLWMCTYNKGLEKVSFYLPQFKTGKVNNEINTLTSNEVRAMCQLDNGDIIVATKDGSIRFFDSEMNTLGFLSQNGNLNSGSKLTDLAYCFYQDKNKNIWIGTKGGGVLLLKRKDRTHFSMQRFVNNPLDNASLSNDNIYSIIQDNHGHILIGTFGGGLNIAIEQNGKYSFLNYKNKLTNYPIQTCSKIRFLLQDKENTLWVATANGMLQIDNFMSKGMKEYYIEKLPDNDNSLSNNDVHYLCVDKKKQLWIGTFGGGLNKLISKATTTKPASFKNYSIKDGMSSDIVLSILEDKIGNLWFASENGISRFSPETNFFQNYDLLDGKYDAHFSEAACLYSKSGIMFFGGNKGYSWFNPTKIRPSKEKPSIEFTKFQLFNNDVKVEEKGSPLKMSIGFSDEIRLTHKQSVFSIEYVALDYIHPDKIKYAFKLENFENDWNYVQSQRKATYTNLPKGTYYFKVKSTNNEGVWVDNEKILKIVILPSFWETWFAYVLYFILFALILYMVYYLTTTFNKLKNEVEVEQKVTDIKLRFFTNISHELRTPLTLILGPVENILSNERINENTREQLQVVQGNANRMLRLINQILDFRKIQNKKMRLKIQPTKLDKLIAEICANFSKEALERNISFRIVNNAKDVVLWIDRDKTDIIIYNLLSNAFKFTPNGKSIEVITDYASSKGDIKVIVKDEGVGIPRENRSVLFERFTSANEIQSLGNRRGSGIGLNLVKELVDLHKGVIEVDSEQDKGTTFTVIFLSGKEHYGNDVDYVVEDEFENELEKNLLETAQHLPEDMESLVPLKEAPLILIIEDNDDMRNFLSKYLNKHHRIETAVDGNDGWNKVLNLIPDLVITDLMMPNMDGLQLTDLIKQNERTCHIPVILLTAKTAIESRLQAMKFGADDYLTKPFSPILLEARVENIIEQRRRLQERYRRHLLNLEPEKVEIQSQDEIFIAKLLDFMEKNIDNSDLTVDDMVSEMAFGRTVFFNKLKGLTGLAPIEFIREMRIKRAAQLLKLKEYNVSQVTYMVGMSDSRYFSKCFKKVYGMTPSEYKKNMEESDLTKE
jgi:signal transduction histidine kinase/ligand-binding sensor domain-containing protein/DNA-binding response OmpR family regulator